MKRIKICYILLSVFFYGCNHDKSPSESKKKEIRFHAVNDSLVYEFINDVVNDTSEINFVLKGDKILDQPDNKYEETLIDSLKKDETFSSKDILFIEQQLKAVKIFKINSNLFSGKEIISKKAIQINTDSSERRWTFWEDYRQKFGKAGYCVLLKPLFSLNHEIVIINMSYHCGGKCGEGGVFIYKKINNKWVKIKEINRWIS